MNETLSPEVGDSNSGFLLQRIFRAVCIDPVPEQPEDKDDYFRWRLTQAPIFLSRFGGRANISGKTILDFGCGYGSMSIFLAQQGARRVVGIDTDGDRVAFAKNRLKSQFGALSGRVDFVLPAEIKEEKFDLILSEDCFEHYLDPVGIMGVFRTYLMPTGKVLIGFSPLWGSPYGGHITYMTKLPWAHLLFPERIIMRERRRYRPQENARAFSEMRGGLNKMTHAKFLATMKESGYEIEFLASNVSDSAMTPLVNVLRKLPFCFEYLTKNLYAIVRPA